MLDLEYLNIGFFYSALLLGQKQRMHFGELTENENTTCL